MRKPGGPSYAFAHQILSDELSQRRRRKASVVGEIPPGGRVRRQHCGVSPHAISVMLGLSRPAGQGQASRGNSRKRPECLARVTDVAAPQALSQGDNVAAARLSLHGAAAQRRWRKLGGSRFGGEKGQSPSAPLYAAVGGGHARQRASPVRPRQLGSARAARSTRPRRGDAPVEPGHKAVQCFISERPPSWVGQGYRPVDRTLLSSSIVRDDLFEWDDAKAASNWLSHSVRFRGGARRPSRTLSPSNGRKTGMGIARNAS